jgi:pentose-5-phosphate-3-epimerase
MKELSILADKYGFIVGVDGGVNMRTIDRVYETGVDVTIVGSGLYKTEDIPKRFNELMKNT